MPLTGTHRPFFTLNQELFPEIGGKASVPESLFVFCSSTSCSNAGNHASLNLCLSVRDCICEVPGDYMQEISAMFLDTVRLLKFFCKNLLCTVYIGASWLRLHKRIENLSNRIRYVHKTITDRLLSLHFRQSPGQLRLRAASICYLEPLGMSSLQLHLCCCLSRELWRWCKRWARSHSLSCLQLSEVYSFKHL